MAGHLKAIDHDDGDVELGQAPRQELGHGRLGGSDEAPRHGLGKIGRVYRCGLPLVRLGDANGYADEPASTTMESSRSCEVKTFQVSSSISVFSPLRPRGRSMHT
jgi:hypothetical protein